MNLVKKIIYCKCPHCKKSGIPLLEKMKNRGHSNIICRECNTFFKRKQPIAWILESSYCVIFGGILMLLVHWVEEYDFIGWLALVFFIFFWCIMVHFLPLKPKILKRDTIPTLDRDEHIDPPYHK